MTAIALPALDGRLPLGFLAALGVTRLVDSAGHAATLAWSERDATAVLHSEDLSDIDDVVGVLRDVVEQMSDGVLVPGGVVGFPPPGEAPDSSAVAVAVVAIVQILRGEPRAGAATSAARSGVPIGNRTRVSALKGPRPDRWTMGTSRRAAVYDSRKARAD